MMETSGLFLSLCVSILVAGCPIQLFYLLSCGSIHSLQWFQAGLGAFSRKKSRVKRELDEVIWRCLIDGRISMLGAHIVQPLFS